MFGNDASPRYAEAKFLFVLLSINLVMSAVELIFGWRGDSAGLVADALDMLGDAFVFLLALLTVKCSPLVRAGAASISGVIEMVLGAGMILEVLRRALLGSEPEVVFMIFVSLAALMSNVFCLVLMSGFRDRAGPAAPFWAFSKTDVLANLGVVAAGGLVTLTGSSVPDLVIASMISAVMLKGGLRVIRSSRITALSGAD